MGNGVTKMSNCFAISAGDISRRHDIAVYITDPLVQDSLGLGHSFCYIRSDHQPAAAAATATRRLSNKVYSDNDETAPASATSSSSFFRTISGASMSANTSTPPSTAMLDSSSGVDRVSSTFESSDSFASIPLQPVPRGPTHGAQSGPIERGFLSGPIERGFLSGPIDRGSYSSSSGPVIGEKNKSFIKSFSLSIKPKKRGLIKAIKRVFSRSSKLVGSKGTVPISPDSSGKNPTSSGRNEPGEEEEEEVEEAGEVSGFSIGGSSQDLQWAQGKAGEDRMHVVVSEEKGWVFVGIYDGFNGPDAPDYLLSNLYNNVHQELEGLLWVDGVSRSTKRSGKSTVSHPHVLRALWEGLRRTEEGFFEVADVLGDENPELALMGSCVLVMLMKGEDVYLMNVGDSRAVLAQSGSNGTDDVCGSYQNLRMINEERLRDVGAVDDECNEPCSNGSLRSIQLTMDHSTYVDKEVERIKREHPDDSSAVMNDRVKGYLKVTRAFGVGFLKQPKWNDKLLEMFQIDYIGTSPYITCNPSLYHHRLNSRDRFLILSSDGLYQYFTNEEVVEEVESFLSEFPEGDPAQHLIEEVLFRAAKKAGMDFHELLDVPQGDRRRYHDDVSVIIISLEGRIWGSSV